MGVLVGWDDETKRSIRLNLEGRWTWDELERAALECVDLAKSLDYRINVIVNFTHSGPLPLGVIPRSRKVIVQLMPHLELLIVVNGDAFVNLMAVVFQHVHPGLGEVVRTTTSLEKARLLIRRESLSTDLRV